MVLTSHGVPKDERTITYMDYYAKFSASILMRLIHDCIYHGCNNAIRLLHRKCPNNLSYYYNTVESPKAEGSSMSYRAGTPSSV